MVSNSALFFRNIEFQGLSLDGKVDTGLLVFVHVILQLCFTQLIERYDDQSHEDVDEEERKDDEKDDVKDGHFDAEPGFRPFFFVSRRHGIL